MMHYASLFFGTSVIAIALGLESHRRLHDKSITLNSQVDADYLSKRRRYRLWTNWFLGLIGALATAAGLIGQGPIWIVLWALIPVFVVVITVLAMTDAFATNRYVVQKIPELRAQTLGAVTAKTDSLSTMASAEAMDVRGAGQLGRPNVLGRNRDEGNATNGSASDAPNDSF